MFFLLLARFGHLGYFSGMPRRPTLQITETEKGFKVDVPATISKAGKRERYFYADKKAAEKHATALRKAYHERGTKAGAIDPALASAAMEAEKMLEPLNVSLLEAVRDYVKRNENAGARITVGDAWTAYQAQLVKLERSDSTISDYQRDRRAMPEWFFALKVGDATEDKLERALDESTSNRGRAWNRKLGETRAVLREALRVTVKAAEMKRRDPEIIYADVAEKLMEFAVAEKCALPFALMLFAGVRPLGELGRISWGNIHKDYIALSGDDSKTGDDRHIPIMPNLRAWLDVCADDDIQPPDWKRKSQAVRKAAGITGQDVLRHTFGSMFYRLHTETETIKAMGHTSFNTTEKFYKRAVNKDEAEAFFAIRPEGAEAATQFETVEKSA
jgi:integrase